MLTKEERSAIAERFISYDGNKLYFAELFSVYLVEKYQEMQQLKVAQKPLSTA